VLALIGFDQRCRASSSCLPASSAISTAIHRRSELFRNRSFLMGLMSMFVARPEEYQLLARNAALFAYFPMPDQADTFYLSIQTT